MEETTNGLPTGPIDREPLGGHHQGAREQEAVLRQVLADAGVELGAYDERIVTWFAEFADNGTFNTMVSWMQRAAAGTAAAPAARAAEELCGRCNHPFDPTDTRWDGRARYSETPFCRSCVDRCHESTDAFHQCAICR